MHEMLREERRGDGRDPPRPANKTEGIGFRTSLLRKRLYVAVAEEQGLRLSEWLRAVADRAVNEQTRVGADS